MFCVGVSGICRIDFYSCEDCLEGVNSTFATAIRTAVVLLMSWGMVFLTGTQTGIGDISHKSWLFLILSGLGHGCKLAVLLSCAADRCSVQGSPYR